MNNQQKLFIPKRILVGFQHRSDTFTGKLAYVIYYDHRGQLRKEASWNSWRLQSIEPQELENLPVEGFVLNKKVGGKRWSRRNTYIRVYDPRQFEVEISVPNLLYILSHCDCLRGKGLSGKFVYAWDGADLVLLPYDTEDYQQCRRYSDRQSKSISFKDLIVGATYNDHKGNLLTYIGRWFYYNHIHIYEGKTNTFSPPKKQHIFWDGVCFRPITKAVAELTSQECTPNLFDLTETYLVSIHGSRTVELFTKPIPKSLQVRDQFTCVAQESPGVYFEFLLRHYDLDVWSPNKASSMVLLNRYCLNDYGQLLIHHRYDVVHNKPFPQVEPEELWARTEAGTEYPSDTRTKHL